MHLPSRGVHGSAYPADVDGGDRTDDDERDPCDRQCPSCGTLMKPVGLPSGEIVSRCPRCNQVAI